MSNLLRYRRTSSVTKELLLVVWFFFGAVGGHRFVLGQPLLGLAYFAATVFTCGFGSIIGFVDGLVLLVGSPRDTRGLPVVWSWQRKSPLLDVREEGSYEPSEALAHIVVHGGLLFLFPIVVMFAGLLLFETSQVQATLGRLALFYAVFLLPLFVLQLSGAIDRSKHQLAIYRKAGLHSRRMWLDAVARAVAIITPRGAVLFCTGLAFLGLALAYQFAELGVLSVLALTAFYIVTSITSVLSGMFARRVGASTLEQGAVVQRQFVPAIARAGESVRDELDVKELPVPPGYFLRIEGVLPARLQTEVRHVLAPQADTERTSLSVSLHRTPRGNYEAPPLRITYTDLLGLTRTTVASLASAQLRVLPALRPAELVPPPRTEHEEPDLLARPHRYPTEELFRFREYVPGDDTRRIHWQLTMRAGKMIVKTPDSRETSSRRVLVVLDSWVPTDWLDHTVILEDALDSLVEAWLAIAQRLVEQGEKVTLVLVARGPDGRLRPETVSCSRSNHAQWLDAGARAEWQDQGWSNHLLDYIAHEEASTEPVFESAIIVTMLLNPPAAHHAARSTTWVYYDPEDALGPPPKSELALWVDHEDAGKQVEWKEVLQRVLFLPYPVGAEENGFFQRVARTQARSEERQHRIALRATMVGMSLGGLASLLERPDAVYRLEVQEGKHRLLGLKNAQKPPLQLSSTHNPESPFPEEIP